MSRYLVSTLARPLKKEGEYSIIITVAILGKRVLRYPSGYTTTNKDTKLPESNTHIKGLSTMMEGLEKFIDEFERDNEALPDADDLKNKLGELSGKKEPEEEDFFVDLDKYINANRTGRKHKISWGSIGQRAQLKRHLEAFRSNTKYKDINASYLNNFRDYLYTNGASNHTVGHYLSIFKSFLRKYAPKRIGTGYNDNEFEREPYTQEQRDKKWALTKEEIIELDNLELSTSHRKYLARFMLLLWSAQRFSDLNKLHKGNVVVNGGGREVLRFTQSKTGTIVSLPISDKLRKWLDETGWEKIEMGKFSDALNKPLGRIKTIWEWKIEEETGKPVKKKKLTTRIARYTGASLMYYSMKLPLAVCRSVTGHKTESSFIKYLSPESIDDSQTILDAFNNF